MANLLVVDDDNTFRKILREILERCGHTIFEAVNGKETLEFLSLNKIDVVLLDVVMPQKGGIETMIDMKQFAHCPKVVIMSGKIDVEKEVFVRLTDQFGVVRILKKPFSKEELLSTLDDVINASCPDIQGQ